jgi:hypothetical protein
MFDATLASAAVGTLSGMVLGQSEVLYKQNSQALVPYQNTCHYGFAEVVLITPIVQELILGWGMESVARQLLTQCGVAQPVVLSACGAAALSGALHLCNASESTLGSALNVTVKGVVYSSLRHFLGVPCAVIAHSVNNLFEYWQSQENWEQRGGDFLELAPLKRKSPQKKLGEPVQLLLTNALADEQPKLPQIEWKAQPLTRRKRAQRVTGRAAGVDSLFRNTQKSPEQKKPAQAHEKHKFEVPIFNPRDCPLLLTAP